MTSDEKLPLSLERIEEVATVSKRTVPKGTVRVGTITESFEDNLTAELSETRVVVTRVPIDRIVDLPPVTRTEDGVTIVPVLEEELVVEKRIRLVEELHIREETTTRRTEVPVAVRRQRAVVERLPVGPFDTHPSRSEPMSSIAANDGTNSTVTAFFDSRSEAEAAVTRIVDLGVSRSAIRMVEGADTSDGSGTTGTTDPGEGRGFFQALGDFLMPDEDRHTFAEGLRRGGYLVSVPTSASNYDAVLDILDDEGTVDMDEREASWKSEGWDGRETGYASGALSGASSADTTDRDMLGERLGERSASSSAALGMSERSEVDAGYGSAERLSGNDYDGTIEVVEENLRVGKRDVSHGRVRVRSYVVEEDVDADVSLHSERVEIERRAVDRPVSAAGDPFQDRTIELEETSQEAVVSKEARVKEEIDLNRLSEDRTETVSDKVRHTEVEVEDDRSDRALGTSGLGRDADKRLID